MDEWFKMRRGMWDIDTDRYLKGVIADTIFLQLKNLKIRQTEWSKFKQREGVLFKRWVAALQLDFDADHVNSLITNDDFWTKTIAAI